MSSKNSETSPIVWIVLILAISILVPVLLNFILPIHITKVIGDETLWLGFWGSFIGSIASFTVAFLTYRTLLHYKEAQNQNERLEDYKNNSIWLAELRRSLSEYLHCCNKYSIAELIYYFEDKDYSSVLLNCDRMIACFKKAEFDVSSLLKSYYDEQSTYFPVLEGYKVVSHDVVVALRQVALLAIEKDIYRFREKLKSPDIKFHELIKMVLGKDGDKLTPQSLALRVYNSGISKYVDRENEVVNISDIEAKRVRTLAEDQN